MSKSSKEKEIVAAKENRGRMHDKLSNLNVFAIVCTCVCLFPVFYGAYFYQELPFEIPTSFGFDGKIRGTTQKEVFVFAFPFFNNETFLY